MRSGGQRGVNRLLPIYGLTHPFLRWGEKDFSLRLSMWESWEVVLCVLGHPQTAGEGWGWEGGWVGGGAAASSSGRAAGGRVGRPQRVFFLPPPLGIPPRDPRKAPKSPVSVLWAPAAVAKREARLAYILRPSWGPLLDCPASPVPAGRQAGASRGREIQRGSMEAFPKSAGCVEGADQGALLPLSARPFPWQPLLAGVARWRPGSWSVLALVPQFHSFLEPG